MIAEQLVEIGMKKKAQGVQAELSRGESTNVHFENSKLKHSQSDQQTHIQVKVILDGKFGISYTNDPADTEGVVQRALDAAAFGSPAYYTFPAQQPGCAVQVYDETILSIQRPEMVQIGQNIVEEVRAYNPEILTDVDTGKYVSHTEFANSSGTHFSEETTGYWLGAGGQLVRGTDILFAGYGENWKKRIIDPEKVTQKALEWFRLAERNAPIVSGEYPVIFTPGGLSVLLLTLQQALNGKNVFLGESPLKEKVGQKIASDCFTLVDNPLLDYAMHTGTYDGEGVPRQVTPLVEKGELRGFLYDLDAAARTGTHSNGHGPGCGPSNWVITPGETPYAEMLRGIQTGLLVESVMGLGQGNPISGEFSVNLMLGYKIENGEIVGRVKDVMLAGNVYDALKDITAVSREQETMSNGWLYGTGYLPYIQVGKLSVQSK